MRFGAFTVQAYICTGSFVSKEQEGKIDALLRCSYHRGFSRHLFTPSGNLLNRLTTTYFQVLPILLTAYTSFSLLPALLSICSSVIEDTHILPTCTLQLYKNSFINRCLFEYIYLWFYVFVCFLCLCVFSVHALCYSCSLLSRYFVCVCHTLLKHIWFDLIWSEL